MPTNWPPTARTQSTATLREASDWLTANADIGEGPDLHDTVVDLWTLRRHKEHVEAARADARYLVREHYDRGTQFALGRKITLRPERPGTTKRWAYANVVKARNFDAWAASRIKFVQPAIANKTIAIPETPDLPYIDIGTPLVVDIDTAWQWRSDLAIRSRELQAQDEVLRERLLHLAAVNPNWDGHPIVFADKWDVRTYTLRYDNDVFAAKYPELFDELAVDMTVGYAAEAVVYEPPKTDIEGERERDERDWELEGERELDEDDYINSRRAYSRR